MSGRTPPSKAAVRRIRQRLHDELRSLRRSNARAVIRRLNPIIRGWAAYYRTQVSSHTFDMLEPLPVGTHLPVGAAKPPQQVEAVSLPTTSASSTSPGKTGGYSATQNRRLPPPIRLDRDRPAPDRQIPRVTRRPGPGRVLGLATAQSTPADQRHRTHSRTNHQDTPEPDAVKVACRVPRRAERRNARPIQPYERTPADCCI
jgi:Group II intron, maturase-specific domain